VVKRMSHDIPWRIAWDLLSKLSCEDGLPIGVSANQGAHTNELIGGIVLAAERAGLRLKIVQADDGRAPDKAAAAARFLVSQSVRLVIGHLSASASLSASRVYGEAAIPFLAPGTTHPDLVCGDRVTTFRVNGRDDDQAAEIVAKLAASGGSPIG